MFNLGGTVNDWTIEAWIYPIEPGGGFDSDYYVLYDTRPVGSPAGSPGFIFYVSNDISFAGVPKGRIGFYDEVINNSPAFSSTPVAYNAWSHIALVRSGTTVTFYINGVSSGSLTFTFSENVTRVISVGSQKEASFAHGWNGYIDDFRITKRALYSGANISVPVSELTPVANTVLLLNFNNLTDASLLLNTVTSHGTAPTIQGVITKFGASAYFNNNGYLTVNEGKVSFNLGGTVNDWTIEAWLYPIEPVGGFTSNYYVLMDTRLHGPGIAFFLGNNIASGIPYSRIGFYEEDVGLGSYSTNTVNYNSWNHVALVRSGTTYTYYINGISSGSGTRTFNNHSGSIAIASQKDRSFAHNWEGYIDDFRITKSAVYSGIFTPPTSALTVLGQTILLLNFDTDFSDSSSSGALTTTHGTTVRRSNIEKFGASAYFNNNGYLEVDGR